jgi:hypothetical protein
MAGEEVKVVVGGGGEGGAGEGGGGGGLRVPISATHGSPSYNSRCSPYIKQRSFALASQHVRALL